MLRRGSIHQWPACPFICDPHADHHPSKSFQLTPACATGPNPLLYPLHHLLLFKLSTLQDLSVTQDVFTSIFLCLQVMASSRLFSRYPSPFLLLGWICVVVLAPSFIGCCRGVRFCLLGGSFASVRLYCLLLLSCLFLVSTGWEC